MARLREGVANVTTQLESTTYLDCHVNRLGGKTVRCDLMLYVYILYTYYSYILYSLYSAPNVFYYVWGFREALQNAIIRNNNYFLLDLSTEWRIVN